MIRRHKVSTFFLLAATALLSGCLSDGQVDEGQQGPDPSGNNAPTITGSPGTSVAVGNSYSFTPSASDPDGDNLTFDIENLPRWADFDDSDGTISGVPSLGDEGTYANVVISVSDGSMNASLPQFSINVNQGGTGSATLTWNPPSENTDGTALTNLAGYRIYYGVQQGNYPNQITIDNPGVTSYVVENLSADTYFFVSTAFNSNGVESGYSNVASKTVN